MVPASPKFICHFLRERYRRDYLVMCMFCIVLNLCAKLLNLWKALSGWLGYTPTINNNNNYPCEGLKVSTVVANWRQKRGQVRGQACRRGRGAEVAPKTHFGSCVYVSPDTASQRHWLWLKTLVEEGRKLICLSPPDGFNFDERRAPTETPLKLPTPAVRWKYCQLFELSKYCYSCWYQAREDTRTEANMFTVVRKSCC